MKEIKLFLHNTKVDVVALLETRVRKENFQKQSDKLNKNWSYINNYSQAVNGRIWFCWDPRKVAVQRVQEHAQGILVEVTDLSSGLKFHVLAIYAFNSRELKCGCWRFIDEICGRINSPLLLGGDFNSVLKVEDRFQGKPVSEAEIKDFQDCIDRNELISLRMTGNQFSWCNNQQGEARIYSLIDRCLANVAWCDYFHNVTVELLERGVPDHCPLFLNFNMHEPIKKNLFRFMNVIAEHEDFLGIVRDKWEVGNRNSLINTWHRLKSMKLPFKQLNTNMYKNIPEKLNNFRESLKQTQQLLADDKLNHELIQDEKETLANIEEKIWKQKSRVDWLKSG